MKLFKVLIYTVLFILPSFSISCAAPMGSNRSKNSYFLYLDMDSINPNVKIKEVTLSAEELYGLDVRLQLFNIFTKNGLLLFTVLPPLGDDRPTWRKIRSKEDINVPEIYLETLNDWAMANLLNETGAKTEKIPIGMKSLFKIGLMIKRHGELSYTEHCLLEQFFIDSTPRMFPNENTPWSIAINMPRLSIKEYEETYMERFGSYSPNHPEREGSSLNSYWQYPRLFLSKESVVEGKNAYHFWTFNDRAGADGYKYDRGIDRFVYVPEIGIVAGSYDFYFHIYGRNYYKAPKTMIKVLELFNREKKNTAYMEEKVMMPIAIDGVKVIDR